MAKKRPERITFELSEKLKESFVATVKEKDLDLSKVLRSFVRDFVNGGSPPPSPS
jgi:hypothetical protein